jgi:phosphohistidine phosphatase
MNVFILRHGIAVEPGDRRYPNDADRPLTAEGKARLKTTAAAMLKLALRFDVLISSPYRRARETAEIVAEGLKVKTTLSELLEPDGSITELAKHVNGLKPRPENVLLVGHEPHLSALASLFISGENHPILNLKKGGLIKLQATTLKPGRCALLKWLLTPRQLELIGGQQ